MIDSVLAGERKWHIEQGDCLAVLKTMSDACVDSIVTDPPAGIGFMGNAWDKDKGGRDNWIAWLTDVMRECLRVLKPGGHALVWSLPRTQHWTATAIENAGFEIRDCISHLFASGFPKSCDVSKQIDKSLGAERKVIGIAGHSGKQRHSMSGAFSGTYLATEPATERQGWGTALKPAVENWILARKPLEGTIARNVLAHGTGGLNIDACRIAHASPEDFESHASGVAAIKAKGGSMAESWKNSSDLSGANDVTPAGRWPAHIVFSHGPECRKVGTLSVSGASGWSKTGRKVGPNMSMSGANTDPTPYPDAFTDSNGLETVEAYDCQPGCPVRLLDEQSGQRPSTLSRKGHGGPNPSDVHAPRNVLGGTGGGGYVYGGKGTASRFFMRFEADPFVYVPKPARKEKDLGLEDFPALTGGEATGREDGSAGTQNPRAGAGRNGGSKCSHPTVKPIALMRYFCRLITHPGGVVLDPFAGSGTTIIGALHEGFRAIGIEQQAEYIKIAKARIEGNLRPLRDASRSRLRSSCQCEHRNRRELKSRLNKMCAR